MEYAGTEQQHSQVSAVIVQGSGLHDQSLALMGRSPSPPPRSSRPRGLCPLSGPEHSQTLSLNPVQEAATPTKN